MLTVPHVFYRSPAACLLLLLIMLPGLFDTRPLRRYLGAAAKKQQRSEADIATDLLMGNPLGRLGRVEEFGALCAFICSPLAAYINAQNILIDGGNHRSVL